MKHKLDRAFGHREVFCFFLEKIKAPKKKSATSRRHTDAMTRKERRDAITAYHEAGHAVVKVLLDMPFDYATIIATDNSRGHVMMTRPKEIVEALNNCNSDPLGDPILTQWLEHEIIEAMAGPIAQHRYAPRSHLNDTIAIVDLTTAPPVLDPKPNRRIVAPGADAQIIGRHIYDLHGEGEVGEHYYIYLKARARALVNAHWQEIEHVAQALLKDNTLSADQVRAAMFPPLSVIPLDRATRKAAR